MQGPGSGKVAEKVWCGGVCESGAWGNTGLGGWGHAWGPRFNPRPGHGSVG